MYKRRKPVLLATALAVSLAATGIVPVIELTGQSVAVARADSVCPSYQEAYNAMIALQTQEGYTEGTPWTNFLPYGRDGSLGSDYKWKGGTVKGVNRGVGCAAFVFLLSDKAFDSLPARAIDNGSFDYEDIKVGDILRVNNSHFVIVLKKSASGVIIAEANYNKSVHWGRAMSKDEVMKANFIITRYPENYVPEDDPSANEVIHNGTAGDLKWTLTGGGVLTISGNGAIPNYSVNDEYLPGWNDYSTYINTIVIEEGVTGIGDYAFYQSKAMGVYIPNSVISIGQSAFYGAGIVSVTIPGSVETIGDDAFRKCENLTSATVSEGVKSIGERAFHSCTSLAYIDFPSSIASVGSGAFTSCSAMTRVRFMPGTGKVTIGDSLFFQCWRLGDVTLPQTLTRIGDEMFHSCSSLMKLYIPATVTEIGNSAFNSCRVLRTISFGGSETQWNATADAYLRGSLQSIGATVEFDIEFENPFAPIPDDPGDLIPEEPTPTVHKHSWAEEWTSNETYHWHECIAKDCPLVDNSSKNDYGEHSYSDWVIDTAATASQDGSKHRKCIVCSYIQTSNIPATGTDGSGSSITSPGGITGDNENTKPGDTGNSGTTTTPSNPSGSGSNNGSGSSGGNTSTGGTLGNGISLGNPSSSTNNSSDASSGNTGNTSGNSNDSSDSSTSNTESTISDSSSSKPDTSNTAVNNVDSNNNNTSSNNSSVTDKDSSDSIAPVDKVTGNANKSIAKQKKKLKNRFNKLLNKQLDNKLFKKQFKKQQNKKALKKELRQELKSQLRKQLKSEFKEQLGDSFEKQFKKLFDDQFDKKFSKWFTKQYKKQNK